jgi:hypothetical protein
MEVGARLLGAAVPALRLESTDGLVSLAELAIAEPERNATDVAAWLRRME